MVQSLNNVVVEIFLKSLWISHDSGLSNIKMRLSEPRYRSISKFIALDAALVAVAAAAAAAAAALVSQIGQDLCSCPAASLAAAPATASAALPTTIEYLRVANSIQIAAIANIRNILMLQSTKLSNCKPVMRLLRMSDTSRPRIDAGDYAV